MSVPTTSPGKLSGPRFWRGLLVACFVVVIGAPLVAGLAGFDSGVKLVEKRRKSARPSPPTEMRQWALYPQQFDAYFKDHFGLRDPLIVGHHWIKRRLLRISPVPKAVIGRQGWLFLSGPPVIDYQRLRPLSRAQLELWRQALEGQSQACAERGAWLVFAVAPNKHTLYPEYLPRVARPVWRRSPLDQLVEYLGQHSKVPIVDMRPALLRAKAEGQQVYRRYDTHWTPLGEYVAYSELMKVLSRKFDRLEALPFDAFETAPRTLLGGDLSLFMGTRNQAREEVVGLTLPNPQARRLTAVRPDPRRAAALEIFESPGSGLKAVMAVDSFGDLLRPYLAEHFARTAFSPGMRLPYSLIDREKPDVVVLEVAERFLADPVLLRHLLLAADAPEPGAIFADGFESGDLRRWSGRRPRD